MGGGWLLKFLQKIWSVSARTRADALLDHGPRPWLRTGPRAKRDGRTRQASIFERAERRLGRFGMHLVVCGLIISWLAISAVVLVLERETPAAQIKTFGDALWWGIVTFMTVGYGDLVPVTTGARIAASFLMFAGVSSIGVISAKISAYFLKQVLFEGRGAVDRTKIRNHFIVCGWKEDMGDLLHHILQLNPDLHAHHLVVVAHKSPEDITSLKADPKLAKATVILGEYFQQSTLERAAPESARKVLILADASFGHDGRKTSATEADARTIMTAIALSNLAKHTLVAAEIIDPSLDHYLKMAGVSEIIYPREYSRLLLGSAAGGTGLVNVFHDLIDPRSSASMTTWPIPDHAVDSTYGAFRKDFETRHPHMLVLGVLENTGNPHAIRELALKEAQKTASIGRLIENLQTVKSLRCNNPVFHPANDYRLVKGTAAILLINDSNAAGRKQKDAPKDTIAA